MVIRQYAPGPALAPFVRAFEFVETQEAMTRPLLPDTSAIVGFRYSGFAIQLDGSTRVGYRMPDEIGLR